MDVNLVLLKNKIILKLNNTGTERKELARKCNITETRLSNFLNKNKKHEPDFDMVVQVVKFLFPKEEKELIKRYSFTISKPRNLRIAMVYAEFHKMFDMLRYLIDVQRGMKNNTNQDWVKTYDVILNNKDPGKIVKKLNQISLHTNEMKVLKQIFMIKDSNIKGEFNYFSGYLFPDLKESINKLSDAIVREYFSSIIYEIGGWMFLFMNDLRNARECFFKNINLQIDELCVANSYHGLGLSYLYNNYNKSIEYLKKSLSIFKKASVNDQKDEVIKSLNFVNCYYGMFKEYSKLDTLVSEDYHEIALVEHLKGNSEKAKRILDSLKIDNNNVKKAFHYYYKGLILNNKDCLYVSIKYFRMANILFYLKLPCLALSNLGESKIKINALFGDDLL